MSYRWGGVKPWHMLYMWGRGQPGLVQVGMANLGHVVQVGKGSPGLVCKGASEWECAVG